MYWEGCTNQKDATNRKKYLKTAWGKRRKKNPAIAGLKIGYNETELRAQVKAAGGILKNEKKVWEIGYREAKNLGLEERIISK